MGEIWSAFATPLREPLVVTVPSETLVAVAAAHGVVDVVALARCDWEVLWPYLFLLFPIPLCDDQLVEMVLFFHCSVMHFASDAKFGQPDDSWNVAAAIASSLFMHLVLLRLHALGCTHTAMLIVSVYLCFFHIGALLVTLYEQRDILALAAVGSRAGSPPSTRVAPSPWRLAPTRTIHGQARCASIRASCASSLATLCRRSCAKHAGTLHPKCSTSMSSGSSSFFKKPPPL